MPARNRFHHQSYNSADHISPAELARVEVRNAPTPAPAGSAEFDRQLADAGRAMRDAGVRYLFLMHGTFAGNDAFGLFGEVARYFPEVGESLRAMGKETFDKVVGEAGNYTAAYAEKLQAGLNVDAASDAFLTVERFHWSSENHHIARAHAAVTLLDRLSQLDLRRGRRVLVWGHSHAGNVLALLTNLLAADRHDRRNFFRACRSYYRWPLLDRVDVSSWPRMQQMLDEEKHPLMKTPPDVATFGTPVRYGWETSACAGLVHFMHHHPTSGTPDYCARFPPSRNDLMSGRSDFVQQLAIAGTDFLPGPLIWRSWLADWRLNHLLARNFRRSDLLSRLRYGQRMHADGRNLLIDYGPQAGTVAHHMLGHAVYTREKWMAWHAHQAARVLYNLQVQAAENEGARGNQS